MTTAWKPQFSDRDYQILEVEELYHGYCTLQKVTVEHALFEGGKSPPILRERVIRLPAVAILLVDPIQRQIVMIEQFRIGCVARNPWLLEVVAGVVEPNEGVEETAQREVLEETGLTVRSLHPIFRYLVSPGYSTEEVFLYCGFMDVPKTHSIRGLAEEGENIKTVSLTFSQAYELLDNGQVDSSPAIIALQWLRLNDQILDDFQ